MLEIDKINAFYGQAHILHGISLAVGEGERVSILGRNGAGKSTLLKSIVNGGPRVLGDVRFDNVPMATTTASDRVRKGIVLVPEDRRIFTHITVAENIRLAQYGAGKDRDLPDLDEVTATFPILKDLTERPGGQLSGGQQQILAVARGISTRPRLMLLDEPTEGLAPVIVESLAEEVIAACDRFGIGLLLAEQSLWFARQCTTRAVILDSGQIVFSGDWAEFDASTELVERFLAV